jgi:hypothetical protein
VEGRQGDTYTTRWQPCCQRNTSTEGGGRRMNPYRDASPRPRCTKCRMRPSRCLCDRVQDTKREPPNLDKTPGQSRLPLDDHAGSRVAYWMRWMRTTGIREGLTVPPEQHQSSQDQRRAYHGVEGYFSGRSPSERPKAVTDGKAAAKTIGEGLNNLRD